MNYYVDTWRDYFNFSGRARRKEYWYFQLFHALALVIGEVLVVQSGATGVFTIIFALYFVASIVPEIAVTVRRLHDIGKSGWWYFVSLVPIAGPIWFLVLMCSDGEFGNNQYGPSPRECADLAAVLQSAP
jgi:uncharacterized membrane protein YhaH (DUF805 family)